MLKLFRCYGDSSSDNESIKEAEMAYFTKNLGVSTIIYSTVPMIEYPTTSPDGVATVFSIQGWKKIIWMLLMVCNILLVAVSYSEVSFF
ncbi:unnamed protein product [Rhizophagus irregularis]|nr:unnamed protein product [Rhizophagus irregularis]